MIRRIFLSLFLLELFLSGAAAQSTIFIVRHAEKAPTTDKDPELSETGHARAESLAKMLKDAGITAIYATEFKRTQQTAAPLAKALGRNVEIVPAKDAMTLITKLRDLHSNALVVGHGNTIPDLIKALGFDTPINIAETDYDNLFIVTLGEKPRMNRLHYR